MLIDTHAHLNFNAFRDDSSQVIEQSLAQGLWIINVGSQRTTSERALKMALKYPKGIYAAVGLHPVHLFEMEIDEGELPFITKAEKFDLDDYQELAEDPKVVAIGETGLDYFHWPRGRSPEEVKIKQKEVFRTELELARSLALPVALHCRGSKEAPQDAYEEMIEILAQEKKVPGVIHCFGSTLKIARSFLELGFYISFTGIITFKNAGELSEVVQMVPLERILLETDAPYLAPEPYRGKRNEPLYVRYIGQRIAQIKGISFAEVAEATFHNTLALFPKIKIDT